MLNPKLHSLSLCQPRALPGARRVARRPLGPGPRRKAPLLRPAAADTFIRLLDNDVGNMIILAVTAGLGFWVLKVVELEQTTKAAKEAQEKQQAILEKLQASLEKQQASLEKQQASLEKLDASLEKQQASLEKLQEKSDERWEKLLTTVMGESRSIREQLSAELLQLRSELYSRGQGAPQLRSSEDDEAAAQQGGKFPPPIDDDFRP